ncbi:MAG TPA: DoxX family protein [Candidatus Binatia bacterium]|nr:DoxX family protein [Candidatus Binatia bacterium]
MRTVSKKALWTGYVMTALPVLLFLFSGIMKLMKPNAAVEGMVKLGLPEKLLTGLGILEIACTILYAVPRTAVLGAILLTGYLGGAILAHLRVGESVISPVIIGVVVWGGIFLRDPRLRELIPFRTCRCDVADPQQRPIEPAVKA